MDEDDGAKDMGELKKSEDDIGGVDDRNADVDEGFKIFPDGVDQVSVAAFATVIIVGWMWTYEEGWGKGFVFL